MQNNCNDINTILNLVFQPGDVFEIRCLDATTPDWRKEHTESGYFTYENIDKVLQELSRVKARGVYFTPNPVHPDLLARSANRLQTAKRNTTTTDADILSRRWLLVDCDPLRRSGISSNDAEHDAALYKAIEISEGMQSIGWPEPIMLDSGNGAQLMYRIDLPANDDGLIKRCLDKIAGAGDDKVKIDTTVHNPSRIWRLSGTWNCKGDEIDDRKHRIAKIISIPEKLEQVTLEQLHELAGEYEKPQPDYPNQSDFNIDAWISEYCPDVEGPVSWKDGRKWIFPVCPFNDAHDNRSAVITQQSNGAIGFTCHHNSCQGNDWHALRKFKGDAPKQPEEFPDVDLSKLLDKNIKRARQAKPKEHPIPEGIFDVPGFVSEVMNFSMKGAPYPNKTLAFAGAMSLQAHLAARKVEARSVRTNPYFVILAKSGTGKDYPRKVNGYILKRLGIRDSLVQTISSQAGLEDALVAHPALFWQPDEFYSFLMAAAGDKSGAKELVIALILTLYSSASESITTRLLANQTPIEINFPNLVILANSAPGGFFESLTQRMLYGGLFSRMTVLNAMDRQKGQLATSLKMVPESVLQQAKRWSDFTPPGSGNIDIDAMEVQIDQDAEELLISAQKDADTKYAQSDKESEEDWRLSIWSRVFENIMKFSLLYACSCAEKPEDTVITKDAVNWARMFVLWETEQRIVMTEKNIHENEFARASQRVINILEHWHQNNGYETPMKGRDFNRKVKGLSPKYLQAVIESLEVQELIKVEKSFNGKRPAVCYSLL